MFFACCRRWEALRGARGHELRAEEWKRGKTATSDHLSGGEAKGQQWAGEQRGKGGWFAKVSWCRFRPICDTTRPWGHRLLPSYVPASVTEWHGLACSCYQPAFDVAALCVYWGKMNFLRAALRGGVRAISQESEWNMNECGGGEKPHKENCKNYSWEGGPLKMSCFSFMEFGFGFFHLLSEYLNSLLNICFVLV